MKTIRTALPTILFAAFLVPAGCGTDDIAPGSPSTDNALPNLVFFNQTGGTEVVALRGTASDNIEVDMVQVSFDNGTTWKTATLDTSPPYTMRTAAWAYAATVGDLPGATNTLLIRVTDGAGNVATSDPLTVRTATGATPASLVGAIGSAAAGEVIALSSGSGYAYDFSGTSSTILVSKDLTLVGNGYGPALSAVACTPHPAQGQTPPTILSAGALSSRLLSVGANMSLSHVRLQGGQNALSISDRSGTNIRVDVSQCLFLGQEAWAIRAVDGSPAADTVTLVLRGCQFDAQDRSIANHGGIFAKGIVLEAQDCAVMLMQDVLGPDDGTETGAGLWIEGGAGRITESCFERSMVAIAASGGSLVVSSCQILGNLLDPTWGIDLKGGAATPVFRNNTISGNTNFGMRIGGRSGPKLRGNVISDNAGAGLYIAYQDSDSGVYGIDLGKNLSGQEGNNDFLGNTYEAVSLLDVQVYVATHAPVSASAIPAEWNYWGCATANSVNVVIWDGNDASLTGHVKLDPSPFRTAAQN